MFLFLSDGFTFVKRHQAALIQRLKSVEPVLEHLREQNVLCEFLSSVIIWEIIGRHNLKTLLCSYPLKYP